MKNAKYLLTILLALLVLSCGKKDDKNNSEFLDDKTGQPTEKKEESTEQPKSNTESTNKSTEELRFHDKTEQPVAEISAVEANKYIGKVVKVNGFVADVYKTDRVAYLNFIEKYPKNPFSGVIFAGKFSEFGDLNIYEGKNVELTGRISVYKEKPQIILDSKSQVKILN